MVARAPAGPLGDSRSCVERVSGPKGLEWTITYIVNCFSGEAWSIERAHEVSNVFYNILESIGKREYFLSVIMAWHA